MICCMHARHFKDTCYWRDIQICTSNLLLWGVHAFDLLQPHGMPTVWSVCVSYNPNN